MFGVCNLRCLPLNFEKDELKGIYKDRMKIGASLADVDPMQLDSSVVQSEMYYFSFKI